MHYYICYNGRKLIGPLTKEQAAKELFVLNGTFKDLYIIAVDEETGKIKGTLRNKKKGR
ncbi:hypothetical protein [Paenibacillus thalictri]|uniref:hypothetical protein n=1 Tax=Paenibacillus thalictri TaxID=2527873 RepID=UPI0013EF2411|nr:hypothetical protein [Paenibacillus thalictri]